MSNSFKLPPLPPHLRYGIERGVASYRKVQDWFAQVPIQLLVGIHFILASSGAAGVYFAIRYALENRYASEIGRKALDAVKFYDWLRPYHFPEHKYTLFAYVGASAILGVMFLVGLLVLLRPQATSQVSRRIFPWIYIADIGVSLWLLNLHSHSVSVSLVTASLLIVVWLATIAAPFAPVLIVDHRRRLFGWFGHPGVLVSAFALEFAVILFPFISGRVVYFNDILEMPSATFIAPTPKDTPRLVDNFDFINQNKIWGNHFRYDPRRNPGEDPPCLPGAMIKLPRSKFLQGFVDQNDRKYYLRYPTGELCFVGPMAEAEWISLRMAHPTQASLVDDVYGQSNSIQNHWKREGQPPDQVDFVGRNLVEIVQGIHMLESIFHHHFQVLNPAKEYDMGRPIGDIISLYGLSFLPVYYVSKLFGELSYDALISVTFATYLVYFAFFIAIARCVLNDMRATAVAFISSVGFVKFLGFIALFVGIGYAPIRHFLDIFVLFTLYKYLRGPKVSWLIAGVVLVMAGILLDRIQGAFAAVALLAWLVVRQFTGHAQLRRWELGAIVFGAVGMGAAFWAGGAILAPNPYAEGFLEGVWGFPVNNVLIVVFFAMLLVAYALIGYQLLRRFDQIHYLSVYLVFLVQLLAIYWIVIPNDAHLYAIMPMFLLMLACLYRYQVAPLLSVRLERAVIGITLALAVTLSLAGSRHYMKTWSTMSTVASDHQVYEWDFEAARIRSTINPKPLADAMALVKKWVPSQSVHIISQFDAPVLWLARRYSAMPHFELGSFLGSERALRRAVEQIQEDRPKILIVDSCILCSPVTLLPGRILPSLDAGYYTRLYEKVDRLKHLQDVFRAVQDDYELVERGMLVSVYRRKPAVAQE